MEPTNSITLWRSPDFMKLWFAQTISELGSRITREGIPLTAALLLNAQPAQMGVLVFVGAVPTLLLGLVAGVWVDRVRRRPIMIVADVARALVVATIPFAAFQHRLAILQLYIVIALTAMLSVFFDVAYLSYMPTLVTKGQVLEGNSKLALSLSVAEITGPSLTGVLVQLITAPVAILFDALSFLFSAASIGLIRKREEAPAPAVHENLWTEALAGWRFIRANAYLWPLAMRAFAAWLFFGFFGSLYVLYAIRELHFGPALLGAVISSGGVGALLGSGLAAPVAKRFGLRTTFLVSAFIYSGVIFLIPLAREPLLWAITAMTAAQVVGDMCHVIYNVNEVTLRQQISSDRILGRVNAFMQLVTRGILPLSSLVGGVLAQRIGIRNALWMGACGVLLSNLFLLGLPDLTSRAPSAS